MQDIFSFIEDTNERMRLFVDKMEYVQAEDLQLDRRAAYRLWINEDCIVVDQANDRSLQYYGGFEYVDKEYRSTLGDYVIYLADDDRVKEHIDFYFDRSGEQAA
jgi:hypothetical protein